MSDNPPPTTALSDNPPPPTTPLSDNPPPPPTPPLRPSSPTPSTSSWASSLLLTTPHDITFTPEEANGHATLLDREAAISQALLEREEALSTAIQDHEEALSTALQELADERAKLAQEKAVQEQKQRANERDRGYLQTLKASLLQEKAELAARKVPEYSFDFNPSSELWHGVVWVVGGMVCIIPGVFACGTVVGIQVSLCRRVSVWLLGVFGV